MPEQAAVPPSQRNPSEAIEDLAPIVYQELRRLAQYYMQRERPDHTLQATALVHEAFLRLASGRHWKDKSHFFAAAAQAMRNLLVDYARERRAAKRNRAGDVPLDRAVAISPDVDEDVLAVHAALEQLTAIDSRQGRIVELRYFGGLNIEETAAVLNISDRTVRREWQMAKAWLHSEIRGQ